MNKNNRRREKKAAANEIRQAFYAVWDSDIVNTVPNRELMQLWRDFVAAEILPLAESDGAAEDLACAAAFSDGLITAHQLRVRSNISWRGSESGGEGREHGIRRIGRFFLSPDTTTEPVRLPGDIGEDLMLLLQEMHDIDSGLCAKFASFLCAAAERNKKAV